MAIVLCILPTAFLHSVIVRASAALGRNPLLNVNKKPTPVPFPLAIAKHPGNATVIRSGDSAGVLRSGWKFLKGPILQDGVAANKILTIRLIKLWKYPCRSTTVGNPTLRGGGGDR